MVKSDEYDSEIGGYNPRYNNNKLIQTIYMKTASEDLKSDKVAVQISWHHPGPRLIDPAVRYIFADDVPSRLVRVSQPHLTN